jgi:hypothetical protein
MHPTIPAFAVIEQSVRVGVPVQTGATIGVLVSQGPDLVEVPECVGKTLGEAQVDLQSRGLTVETVQVWSEEAPGSILSQSPPPGSLVQNASKVQLVIGSGTRVPVGARLGDGILLVAYELPSLHYQSGEALSLTLWWQAIQAANRQYMVFVHIVNSDGSVVSRQEGPPAGGAEPTDGWEPGKQVIDVRQIGIPSDLPPGEYSLQVGMYDEAGPIPVSDSGHFAKAGNALVLNSIRIDQQ